MQQYIEDQLTTRFPKYGLWHHKWKQSGEDTSFVQFLIDHGCMFLTFMGEHWRRWEEGKMQVLPPKERRAYEKKQPEWIKHCLTLCYINSTGERYGNLVFCLGPNFVDYHCPFDTFTQSVFWSKKERLTLAVKNLEGEISATETKLINLKKHIDNLKDKRVKVCAG